MKTSLIKLFHSLGRKQAAKAMSKREGITQIPDVITSQGEGAAAYTTLREAGLTDDALGKLINSEQDIVRLLNKVESMRNQMLPKRGSGIASLETGPERYNRLTGLDKSKTFTGWTPTVVPKATNIPASKINHQIIADRYGIDVELIRGKDWIEVLEVIKKLGYAEGGLANIMQTPRRGRVTHPGGYAGSKRQRFIDMYRSGRGTRQKYIDLSGHGFKKKSLAVPIDPFRELMIQEMLMSGALTSELKDGGLAGILEV